MMTSFSFLVDKELLDRGIRKTLIHDLNKTAHFGLFGSTGSGKTYASKLLLGHLISANPGIKVYVADYKGSDDFDFILHKKGFFRYNNVSKFFDLAIQTLESRQSDVKSHRGGLIFFVDEFASFLLSLEKKEQDIRIQQLAKLVMLGRSFNIHFILSQQRPDAIFFGRSRDNFGTVLALGALSKETIGMIFNDSKGSIEQNNGIGQGYLRIDGRGTFQVIVPKINNLNLLHETIAKAVP